MCIVEVYLVLFFLNEKEDKEWWGECCSGIFGVHMRGEY